MSTNSLTPVTSSRAANIAAHAAFVPIGIVTVLLGPMLLVLSPRWSLTYAQAGSLFTVQFVASTGFVLISGVLVTRVGFRFAIISGLLATAVALAGLAFSSYVFGMGCIALYGAGLGLAVPACNLLVAEVNPTRRSAALNLLNFSWSTGAVACPFLVAAAMKTQHVNLFLLGVSGLLLAVLVGIATLPAHQIEPKPASAGDATAQRMNWRSSAFVVLCALFFLYVGAENAFGGWVASYAKNLTAFYPALAAMTPSFFYTALMIGRWLAPFALRTIDDVKLARAGLVITALGMAGVLASHSKIAVLVSAVVAGFGCSAVYPITIAMLSREFGSAASRVGSVMFTVANLGGASLPWLVGSTSQRFGGVRKGLLVPLVAVMLMYALYTMQWRGAGQRQSSTP